MCYYTEVFVWSHIWTTSSGQADSPRLQNIIGTPGGITARSVTTPAPVPEPPSPPIGSKSRNDVKREAQDAINAILPPKEWVEDDQVWRQLVLIDLSLTNILRTAPYISRMPLIIILLFGECRSQAHQLHDWTCSLCRNSWTPG